MDSLPKLVQSSKLPAISSDGYTVHSYSNRKEYWQQESLIGGGGFGNVWKEKCIRGKSNIDVRAVKQIKVPPLWMGNKTYLRELELAAQFSTAKYNRFFVQSYGWYELNGALNVAMEYLELGDLQGYLIKNRQISEAASRDICYQILQGINYMHQSSIAHRDLKPANILIKSKSPGSWWVKIADFGISKRIEEEMGTLSTIKGTPSYMPPESLGFVPKNLGFGTTDAYPADMWALGAIAFEMLSGQPPFQSIADLAGYAMQARPFPSETLIAARVGVSACSFVADLLSLSPAQRPSAADSLKYVWISLAAKATEPPPPKPPTPSQPAKYPVVYKIPNLKQRSPPKPKASEPARESHKYEGSYHNWPSSRVISKDGKFAHDKVSGRAFPKDTRKFVVNVERMSTEEKLYSTTEYDGVLTCIAFSPDSSLIALGGWTHGSIINQILKSGKWYRGIVRILAADTGKELHSFKPHDGDIQTVAFSPDSKVMVAGGVGRAPEEHGRMAILNYWRAENGRKLHTVEAHVGCIESVVISPDGTLVASGGCDKIYLYTSKSVIRLWDAKTGREVRSFPGHRGKASCVAFSPNGNILAAAIGSWGVGETGSGIRLWETATARQLCVLEAHQYESFRVVFSPDGKALVSYGFEYPEGYSSDTHDELKSSVVVKLWDASRGYELRSLKEGDARFEGVKFLLDGRVAILGTTPRKSHAIIEIWDISL